jgi:hypothetical protein
VANLLSVSTYIATCSVVEQGNLMALVRGCLVKVILKHWIFNGVVKPRESRARPRFSCYGNMPSTLTPLLLGGC